MTEFFPGSRTPIPDFPPEPSAATAPFDLELAVGKPVDFVIEHRKNMPVYSIGQLAVMLNRKPGTIRMWERQEIIPVALWSKVVTAKGDEIDPIRGYRRYYSAKQLIRMRQIAADCGVLEDTSRSIRKTSFIRLVRELWAEDE